MEELIEKMEIAGPCTSGARREQLRIVRAMAERGRQNATIRRALVGMLERINDQSAAEVFRAYYLEGLEPPSARTLANRFFIDKRTVFKQLLRVCDQLRIMLFGVDALFDLEGRK